MFVNIKMGMSMEEINVYKLRERSRIRLKRRIRTTSWLPGTNLRATAWNFPSTTLQLLYSTAVQHLYLEHNSDEL